MHARYVGITSLPALLVKRDVATLVARLDVDAQFGGPGAMDQELKPWDLGRLTGGLPARM